MKNLKKILQSSGLLLLLLAPLRLLAEPASGGNDNLTKALHGESGVNEAASADYSAAYALGEDVAGTESRSTNYDFSSGYFSGFASGYTGNFSLLNATVGQTKIMQSGFQVGVPLNATVQLVFSNPLDPSTIAQGIQVNLLMDHLANPQDQIALSTYSYTVMGTTVVIAAQGAWLGNTFYDVVANGNLRSVDGFVLAQPTHTQFITVLDPNQENVVLQPIPMTPNAQALSISAAPSINLDIPTGSLSDYAYVLVSQDPVHAPLLVTPSTLQQATQKAQVSGGAYQTPLALQEIAAFNEQGQPLSLSKSITFSVSTSGGAGLVTNGGVPIRPETLSLWSLDSAHALWVKMPDSHPNGGSVMGAVTQFSVYALMGSASADTSAVIIFPLPWRPHGPNAGTGAGQTGTEAGGITFSNLPSECDIKIYTVSGSLVRELHHSDLIGPVAQEVWNGNTSGGEHAASGVYLWRVESSIDSKNGKLMLIR
jgi:hypothetical protein